MEQHTLLGNLKRVNTFLAFLALGNRIGTRSIGKGGFNETGAGATDRLRLSKTAFYYSLTVSELQEWLRAARVITRWKESCFAIRE